MQRTVPVTGDRHGALKDGGSDRIPALTVQGKGL